MPSRRVVRIRPHRHVLIGALALLVLVLAPFGPVAGQDGQPASRRAGSGNGYTKLFYLDHCDWSATGGNLFFPLDPGRQHVLRGRDGRKEVETTITVLDETEVVDGITTRVVEERETEDGELVEVSRNFFALCAQSQGVFYFGEEVDDYKNGEIVGHDGAWRADEGENEPGLIIPALPQLGARYYQEIAPGIALDRAEIVAVDITETTPAGKFDNCFRTLDTTPLEPRLRETKVFCPEVGIVRDATMKLISFT